MYQLHLVRHLGLFKNILHMLGYGFSGNVQFFGNLIVSFSAGDQCRDFLFPFREVEILIAIGGWLSVDHVVSLGNEGGPLTVEQVQYGVDLLDQFADAEGLFDVVDGAQLQTQVAGFKGVLDRKSVV